MNICNTDLRLGEAREVELNQQPAFWSKVACKWLRAVVRPVRAVLRSALMASLTFADLNQILNGFLAGFFGEHFK